MEWKFYLSTVLLVVRMARPPHLVNLDVGCAWRGLKCFSWFAFRIRYSTFISFLQDYALKNVSKLCVCNMDNKNVNFYYNWEYWFRTFVTVLDKLMYFISEICNASGSSLLLVCNVFLLFFACVPCTVGLFSFLFVFFFPTKGFYILYLYFLINRFQYCLHCALPNNRAP